MLRYSQKDGDIWLDGHYEGRGYSGRADGRNNPDMEHVRSTGPIPKGKWKIGEAFDHKLLGPCCFRLTPVGHTAHGRSAFLIHGDNKINDASEGCIVAGRTIRHRIRDDKETELDVVRSDDE